MPECQPKCGSILPECHTLCEVRVAQYGQNLHLVIIRSHFNQPEGIRLKKISAFFNVVIQMLFLLSDLSFCVEKP
jgi:hypothetical protein